MNSTDHNRRSAPSRPGTAGKASLAFATFALAHSGCKEEASELRLDERSLVGWCRRCDDWRIFVDSEGERRKGDPSAPFPRGGSGP